jgi:RNA polymerase sigma-70 factor (ECF subfamily)
VIVNKHHDLDAQSSIPGVLDRRPIDGRSSPRLAPWRAMTRLKQRGELRAFAARHGHHLPEAAIVDYRSAISISAGNTYVGVTTRNTPALRSYSPSIPIRSDHPVAMDFLAEIQSRSLNLLSHVLQAIAVKDIVGWSAQSPSPGADVTAHPRTDVAAFDELATVHAPFLQMIARRLTGDKDVANDLVQETLVRAFLHFATFEPGTNARAWLVKILTRLHIDHLKHAKVVLKANAQLATLEVVANDIDVTSSEISDAALQAAVGALDPDLRVVVECVYMQRLSYKQAADRLKVPIGTIGSRLTRALQQLKTLLTSETSERDDTRR